MENNNTHREIKEIEADLVEARKAFDQYSNVQFEGHSDPDNYYLNPHHKKIEALASELAAAKAACSPLKTNLAAEKAWFNSQGFTGADMQKAQKACLARGYTVSELMAAAKASK
jgi:hypothetical protein